MNTAPHTPTVTLLAAMSENRVIGRANRLPWRLPADLKRFKRLTTGRTIIMGRKTWDSLPKKPLPNRRNIVLSRAPDFRAEGAEVAHNLDAALRLAGQADPFKPGHSGPGSPEEPPEVFVIGGEQIFNLALPFADRLELTIVHATIDGDAWFPEFDEATWEAMSRERHEADERNEHAYSFVKYGRREPGPHG